MREREREREKHNKQKKNKIKEIKLLREYNQKFVKI